MCPKLVEFMLEYPVIEPEQVTVGNRFLDDLTKHGTLKIIELANFRFTDEKRNGELIARCHDLEKLDMEQMTHDNLITIAQNCPELISLILQVSASNA